MSCALGSCAALAVAGGDGASIEVFLSALAVELMEVELEL